MTRYETQDDPQHEAVYDISARVRMNAGSAGLGAACLLFFGFLSFTKPGTSFGDAFSAQDWFTAGNVALFYTMRVGGVVLGLVALASLTGAWPVLAADAIVSIPVGALLMASGVLMLMGNGDALQSGLLLVFGVMFIRSGVMNARLAMAANRLRGAVPPQGRAAPPPPPRTERHSVESNLAGEVLRRRADVEARPDAADDGPVAATARAPQPPRKEAAGGDAKTEPAPEGFLASFAPRRDDQEAGPH
ncbi:MAG: hypothetical protein FLDDKLPJ_01441 [Phycisphaerae bacterium]|nr:hypothetical protein [Phycisphaerae bacterium]